MPQDEVAPQDEDAHDAGARKDEDAHDAVPQEGTGPQDEAGGRFRIGELSRRSGVSDHVLRAWERRYGLLTPTRSPAGYRLYSEHDEHRVRQMTNLLLDGLPAAEAAKAALRDPSGPIASVARPVPQGRPDAHTPRAAPTGEQLARLRARMAAALESLDDRAAQDALDDLFARVKPEDALRAVVMPYLHDLGERWALGEISVVQEHFASQVVRGRVAALGRGWGRGAGPKVLLACPPGERHDLALLTFGVVLSRRGWAVSFLGADTPLAAVAEAARSIRADLVVLSATGAARLTAVEGELAALADALPVYLAGPGGSEDLARRVGGTALTGDPVTAAQTLVP